MPRELPISRVTRWCDTCASYVVHFNYRHYVLCGHCNGIDPKDEDPVVDPIGDGLEG